MVNLLSHPTLTEQSHRPYSHPDGQWLMAQTWFDLLFMHWPIEPLILSSLIPSFLEIDTFDSMGWIGVVPFAMKDIRFCFAPPVPFFRAFLELNVRTYVKCKGKAGVYFFSLDAAHSIAVEVARTFFCLPYYNAKMSKTFSNNKFHYVSQRTDSRGKEARLDLDYQPTGEVYFAQKGSLEHWLTERYCFLAADHIGQPIVGEIHHRPWPLQKASADIKTNSMCEPLGIVLPRQQPLLHFVRTLDTIEWSISSHDNVKQ